MAGARSAPSALAGRAPRPHPERMHADLERTLSGRDVTLLVIGNVIGSGIFIVPATVLAQVGGDVGTALVVWVIGGVLSLLGALTYGELGAMRPQAGGLYVFMRDAFGPFVAFLFGWTLFFAIGGGAIATLGTAFVGYFEEFVPLSTASGRVVAGVMLVTITVLNIWGTRESANVNNWTTGFKLIALFVIALALIFAGDALSSHQVSLLPAHLGISAVPAMGVALVGVLWAFEGWQWVTFTVGETLDPGRTFPRAITLGTAVIALVYCLAAVGYVAALGPERAASSESIASAAVQAVFGRAAGKVVAAAILVSIFSAGVATMLTASRVVFAMARDGLFFRRLAEVHPKLGTPALAIAALGLWSLLLASTGTFEQLLTYVVFTGWIFYGLGAAAIFVFRVREKDAPRPFSVPGYPVTPLLFVLASAAIVANTLVTQPVQGLLGLLAVFTGAPAFVIWRYRARRTPEGE